MLKQRGFSVIVWVLSNCTKYKWYLGFCWGKIFMVSVTSFKVKASIQLKFCITLCKNVCVIAMLVTSGYTSTSPLLYYPLLQSSSNWLSPSSRTFAPAEKVQSAVLQACEANAPLFFSPPYTTIQLLLNSRELQPNSPK